jgi:RNA polymerase sigma-70 factor, ECF subfamily
MTTEEFLRQQIIPLAYRQLPAAELMTRAGAGDPEAFIALVCLKYSHVESACRQVLGPTGPTEDVALEAFVQLWRQRDRLRNVDAVDGWLTRTARNLARKFLRAQTRERRASRGWWQRTGEPSASVSPPDHAAIQAEMVRRVRLAVAKQSDADQRVLWMAEHALGDADAAETLGLSVPNYRVRLHRARQRLRTLLKKYGVTPVVGAMAFVGARTNRAASAVAAWWATTAGKVLLLGLTLCCVAAIAGWALTRDPQPADVQLPNPNAESAPPLAAVAVESLQARNRRILEEDVLPRLLDESRRTMPADNQVSVTAVRAFGSEVEVELRPVRPIPDFFPVALRLRYCVFRREMSATADVAGTGTWVAVDSTRPIVIEVPLPLVPFIAIPVVAGRDRWAWARDTFALLPPDPRAEDELIRHMFGPTGGELLLPVGHRGVSGFPGGLILADVNKGLYVRDPAGRWRYVGECPGWGPVVVDGEVYCVGHGLIRSRPLSNSKAPWARVCDEPPVEKGAELRYHFVAGGKLGVAVFPHKLLTLSVGKPAAIWEQVENPHWHDGMTVVGGQLYGYDQKRLYSRPFADPRADLRPIGPWPEGCNVLFPDGDRLVTFDHSRPGPIYARPLTAGPDDPWTEVGKVHDPYKR